MNQKLIKERFERRQFLLRTFPVTAANPLLMEEFSKIGNELVSLIPSLLKKIDDLEYETNRRDQDAINADHGIYR